MIRGIVRGKTIELDADTGLPEGQEVTVTVQPVDAIKVNHENTGAALKRAFGGWNDDDIGLDEFLEWNRRQRKYSRLESEA
jgi:hypothetical protein